MRDLAREKLIQIIKEHGFEICDRPQRIKALLLDFCGQHRVEINTLVLAISEGLVQQMQVSRGTAPQLVISNLANRLQEHVGLTAEAARWAILQASRHYRKRINSLPESERCKPCR